MRRSLPIERSDLAEVAAVLSPGGFVSLDNYRGVPVLQVSRRIRGVASAAEPWVLVQGVNARDALSMADERRRFLLATLLLLLFSIAALAVAAWRHGSSVRARHQAEELRSKAAKLQKQTDLLHTVTDNIDVLTVLMNRDQEVVFTNQATANAVKNTIAGIVGCIGFGLVSDTWFGARRPPANLLFACVEIAGLCLLFFGPHTQLSIGFAFVLYGVGLNGLVTSLGGLFAVDISPKRAAGAAMGVIGVFSYIGAALQENISGHLIERGMTLAADGTRTYDFEPVILFWLGSSLVSMLLAATLWRVRLRD